MIMKLFIILILIVSFTCNYDLKENHGEYIFKIFMGSSGS